MLFLLWIIQRQTYSPVLLVLPGQSITVSHENKRRQKTVKKLASGQTHNRDFGFKNKFKHTHAHTQTSLPKQLDFFWKLRP